MLLTGCAARHAERHGLPPLQERGFPEPAARERALSATSRSSYPLRASYAERRGDHWYFLLEPTDVTAPMGSHKFVSVYDDGRVDVEGGK